MALMYVGSLEEDVNTSLFQKYWGVLKNNVRLLQKLGGQIVSLKYRNQELIVRAEKAKKFDLVQKLSASKSRIDQMMVLWQKVRTKLNQWLPKFLKAEQQSGVSGFDDGFGVVPVLIILGVSGIAAIAFISTKGLQLIKDFASERRLIDDIEKGIITAEQATEFVSVSKAESPFAKLGKMGSLVLLAVGGTLVYTMIIQKKRAALNF